LIDECKAIADELRAYLDARKPDRRGGSERTPRTN
jgi:hypothetical protein